MGREWPGAYAEHPVACRAAAPHEETQHQSLEQARALNRRPRPQRPEHQGSTFQDRQVALAAVSPAADQRFEVLGSLGMLQAGNHRPTEVVAYGGDVVSTDKPEHFFLQRYEKAYRAELDHFVAVLAGQEKLRVSIEDGVKALELADAATTSWREKRIVTLG